MYAGSEWVILSGVNNETLIRDIRIRTAKALGVDEEDLRLLTRGRPINDIQRVGDTFSIRVRMSAHAEVNEDTQNKAHSHEHRKDETDGQAKGGRNGPGPSSKPGDEQSKSVTREDSDTRGEEGSEASDSNNMEREETSNQPRDPGYEGELDSPRGVVDLADAYLQAEKYCNHALPNMLMMLPVPDDNYDSTLDHGLMPRPGRASACREGYRVKSVLEEHTLEGTTRCLVEWEDMHPDSGAAVWVDAIGLDCPCGYRARLTYRRQEQTTGIPFTEDDAKGLALSRHTQEEEEPLLPGEYEVYEVVDMRTVGELTEYRVRWKKYGKEDDDWLSKEEMNKAQDAIWEYERATRMGYPRHTVPPNIWSNDA